MVRIWNQESADWRLELEVNADNAYLSLRAGAEGRALIVNLGRAPTVETVRRASAKAVKAIRELGASSAFPEYYKMIESPVADLSNQSSDGCGAITAGLFLGAFAEGVPWVHMDIAGTAWTDRARREYQTVGATGAGVTTLYQLCADMAEQN